MKDKKKKKTLFYSAANDEKLQRVFVRMRWQACIVSVNVILTLTSAFMIV